MRSSLVDLLPELLELLVFSLGSAGLSLAGAYIERFALVTFEQGNVEIAAWAVVMGAVALYFAYNVGTDKVRPKFRDVRAALA
ncbi:hypothetical protein C5B91_07645 [Haloferax sp. Atlit-10N]|uniref:DUF8151 domain-containing protein n=1 Tax=Haloferax prahovense (strain DSM 18310 / JCM 13924 / TL6) TaxID=1227461 RepID=M0G361_HALPT|nr:MULTISPECIES: hypothetical protein [Haloferax]ELZ65264.1 hypothetical protein C457_17232 [Haloferax prahovense DSM 18310]RDZ45124.1 hypothetical protein C5B87_13325 [Haloferax sp. Atlit-16N]RDZ48485.1 hypothetical protein C5B86_05445 [Haloferax sp. Atlit-19N]RDZ59099.1 hypothetical protein C5B91_07645 [Haloferax sp. Atlit-10N]